jgi:hypothetical protein
MRPTRPNITVFISSFICLVILSVTAFPAASAALNPERHYEMVSPVYKEGYGVKGVRAADPGGESVVFSSNGGFAGALSGGVYASHFYVARRGATGWSTTSVEPPFGGVSDLSSNLEYVLGSGPLGPNAGVENHAGREEVLQLHRTDAPDTVESWEVFGNTVLELLNEKQTLVLEVGASADLCHVVLGHTEGALLPAAENANEQIYDLSRGCDGKPPALRLIGVTNSHTPEPISRSCQVELGTGHYVETPSGRLEQVDNFNVVSSDGSEMFFTTNVQEGVSGCGSEGSRQLFVRLGGNRTVEVSRPLETGKPFGGCVAGGLAGEVPCAGALTRASAYFKGASEDGSKVFFTTSAPLLSADEDTGTDLYMATIGCPDGASPPETRSCEPAQREVTSLVQVSHDLVAKEAAEVQGVVRLAPDGSRIYYVARGVLSEGANAQGQTPAKGADNLYVYDSVTHETAFVAELCSGPQLSGVVEDVRCPSGLAEGGGDAQLLWESIAPKAQSTANGAFLVFCTYAQLSAGDTDSALDIYRYDAETGALERVSVGEDGYDANGNASAFDANIAIGFLGVGTATVVVQHEMATRAISEDGSRIVFDTAEPLSPAATNGNVNIYEWDEGNVSLISSGTSEEDDSEATITASGRDIFFTTYQGLVAQDTDGLPDIYDARQGEGFPAVLAEREPCSGDACQGPLTNPAPLLVPGSVSQAPGESFTAPTPEAATKAKKKEKTKKKAKKIKTRNKHFHNSGSATKTVGRSGR